MVIVRDGLPPVGGLGLRHSPTITPLRGYCNVTHFGVAHKMQCKNLVKNI